MERFYQTQFKVDSYNFVCCWICDLYTSKVINNIIKGVHKLFMSKKNKQELIIKEYLTNAEMAAFIDGVISNLIREDVIEKYYEYKHRFINEFTLLLYCGIDVNEYEVETNIYKMVGEVLEHIDLNQYQDIKDAIDEGLQYELNRIQADNAMASMISASDSQNTANIDKQVESVEKLITSMEEKYGKENVAKLLSMALDENFIKAAQEQVKANKKTS